MSGDIVKVTPSSKVVGDMALYMTSNGLTEADVMSEGEGLAFPESVIDLFRGNLGQAPGGFPEALAQLVLKGEKPFTDRPNAYLEPVDFEQEMKDFQEEFGAHLSTLDFLSFKMYPDVFRDFNQHRETYGEVMCLPTPAFFYGLREDGDEISVKLAPGRNIIILIYWKRKEKVVRCTKY
jgi:pyruvate carboxylase